MKHRASTLVLTGVLGLGGLAAGVVVAPAVALAQTSDTSTADAVGDQVSRIASALSGLVSDGSITQAQADEVATTLAAELPPPGGPGGHGGPRGGHLDGAAEVIGITVDELRTALEGGQTLAQVAEANGVERQQLIDALVAEMSADLDEAVAEGDLAQEQADARKAALVERVTARVDQAGLPARGDHGGPGAHDTDGADDVEAGTSTS